MYLLVYVGELVCLQLYVHVYILHVEYIYVLVGVLVVALSMHVCSLLYKATMSQLPDSLQSCVIGNYRTVSS